MNTPSNQHEYCTEKCNECPIIRHPNSRLVTRILYQAYRRFGEEFFDIVQASCPNLTVCFDCRIDDFCHFEGCEIAADLDKSDNQGD